MTWLAVSQGMRAQADGFPRALGLGKRLLSQGWGSMRVAQADVLELVKLAKARQGRAREYQTARYEGDYSFGVYANNSFAPHFCGCLCEFAVAGLLGVPYHDTPESTGPDDGIDVRFQGQGVDVKGSMAGQPRMYPFMRRYGLRADLYVLAVTPMSIRDWRPESPLPHDIEVQARGWLRKGELLPLAVQHRETDRNKSIGQELLHPFSELLVQADHPALWPQL